MTAVHQPAAEPALSRRYQRGPHGHIVFATVVSPSGEPLQEIAITAAGRAAIRSEERDLRRWTGLRLGATVTLAEWVERCQRLERADRPGARRVAEMARKYRNAALRRALGERGAGAALRALHALRFADALDNPIPGELDDGRNRDGRDPPGPSPILELIVASLVAAPSAPNLARG